MQRMRIPALANLVAECWEKAEEALQGVIRQKHPDRDEEMITTLLNGELNDEFSRVSESGAVEIAFLSDLCLSLPDIPRADLSKKITRRLIATIHFHPKEIEKKTGGDFGLVIIRPNIRRANSRSRLLIDNDYQRGLLCQAKVLRRSLTWGKLTANQQELLSEKLSYFALVLYKYADQGAERRELAPLSWQTTRDAAIEEIQGWLKSGKFPKLEGSRQVICDLAQGAIGTDDKNIISGVIAPYVRPSLKITVGWREGDGPGPDVQLRKSTAPIQLRHVQTNDGARR
jgi:hypothetical protein